MTIWRNVCFALLLAWVVPAWVVPAWADGVDVGKPSSVRNLVPAESLERQAAQQYGQLKQQAAEKRALAPDDHPQVKRLRAIAARLIPYVERFNSRAKTWKWEVNLIGSKQINAFCMPGGKIVFYTGILDGLKLTDHEVAMVMGHEIAHALREHARARMAKGQITQLGAAVLGELIGGGKYAGAFQMGGNLLNLKFSRDDESEADVVGLDLIRGQRSACGKKCQPPTAALHWSFSRPIRRATIASRKSRSISRKSCRCMRKAANRSDADGRR